MTTTLTTASSKIDVSAASMSELVAFYNATTGKSIKKFETRAKGVERCLALLVEPKPAPSAMGQIAKSVIKADATTAPAKRPLAPKAQPKPAAKKPAAAPVGRGRAHFSEAGVITILHKGENPKRGTAAERYDLYRSGMTVAAYIAAGGQRRDVVWDQKMGWIKVVG